MGGWIGRRTIGACCAVRWFLLCSVSRLPCDRPSAVPVERHDRLTTASGKSLTRASQAGRWCSVSRLPCDRPSAVPVERHDRLTTASGKSLARASQAGRCMQRSEGFHHHHEQPSDFPEAVVSRFARHGLMWEPTHTAKRHGGRTIGAVSKQSVERRPGQGGQSTVRPRGCESQAYKRRGLNCAMNE
jgi:hypothetical protein